jgi:hypothetical protein
LAWQFNLIVLVIVVKNGHLAKGKFPLIYVFMSVAQRGRSWLRPPEERMMNPSQRKASLLLIVTLTMLWGRLAAAQAVWRISRLQ